MVVGKPNGSDPGVVQYDHGKACAGMIERTGFLALPPATLFSAAQALAVHRYRALDDHVRQNMTRILLKRKDCANSLIQVSRMMFSTVWTAFTASREGRSRSVVVMRVSKLRQVIITRLSTRAMMRIPLSSSILAQ